MYQFTNYDLQNHNCSKQGEKIGLTGFTVHLDI